ncbi:hypothetical protein AM493_01860 [Flavobacterium akiainvivens]|uniref:Addiction module protein n=1 Tax=Flavobacterium akiainvivens TaxID=1202724 RepID=A0A0M8MG66_9FLAO|nr:hypothetical protein [Flavobacterium akiainvivens]KOS04918.1 hypothetical protein AM493_01860 [Flavobacterium akiainvivens]SFQ42161.1 hypothetical protein SAMN05444144_104151 [Flavobacterium akiainvivens]
MSTLELKNIVISQIQQIEDKSLLEALRTILEAKTPVMALNDLQKEEIDDSRKAVAAGNYKGNETLNNEVMQWLSGK